MPIFFQQQINEHTRLGIWKIEEDEYFFRDNVPQHRDVSHPHKRLQHLAGRFLLRYLFPDFPYELIEIADTRKPFLPGDRYHFSISHCDDFAAAIVSSSDRVGIDIEVPVQKISRIVHKYLSTEEQDLFQVHPGMLLTKENLEQSTLLWSAKEAVFKWYGLGGVDFRKDIRLKQQDNGAECFDGFFSKNSSAITIQYRKFHSLMLAWLTSAV